MGEEPFVNPVNRAQAPTVQADRVSPEAANAGVAAAKAKTLSAPLRAEGADNNAWQKNTEVQKVIDSLTGQNREVSITMDPETRQIIIKVLDSATGEVIRRMPLKDPIHSSDALSQFTGLLLNAIE